MHIKVWSKYIKKPLEKKPHMKTINYYNKKLKISEGEGKSKIVTKLLGSNLNHKSLF